MNRIGVLQSPCRAAFERSTSSSVTRGSGDAVVIRKIGCLFREGFAGTHERSFRERVTFVPVDHRCRRCARRYK
jgi:hypothetical protein